MQLTQGCCLAHPQSCSGIIPGGALGTTWDDSGRIRLAACKANTLPAAPSLRDLKGMRLLILHYK